MRIRKTETFQMRRTGSTGHGGDIFSTHVPERGWLPTELSGPQSFKVTTEQSASMSPADRTAQEEFLRKVSRLYRAVYGARHTADDVQSRLKQIREALKETPAVDKQLGAIADSIQQREPGDSTRVTWG